MDLLVCAYRWVVDQVDKTIEEFKIFREWLDKEERENWDKMVKKQYKKRSEEDGCDGSSSEEDGITKEDWMMKKETEDRTMMKLQNDQ